MSSPSLRAALLAPQRAFAIGAILPLIAVLLAGGLAADQVRDGDASSVVAVEAAEDPEAGQESGAAVTTAAEADTAAPAAIAPPEPALPPVSWPVTFARAGGVDLVLPSSKSLVVGFHEAAVPGGLQLTPVGNQLRDDTWKVVGERIESRAPNYVVMSSRGRDQHPTSAVDIPVPVGEEIVSPVDGTVTAVWDYTLYGDHHDTRIEIAPTARPDLRVVVIHVEGAAVTTGDALEAGQTRIAASSRKFPFTSHVDGYAGGRHPHVHVEVKPA